MLRSIDWNALDELVRSQQVNRERYTPTVSLFRWWARRPHSLIGALLDAASDFFDRDLLTVSDPFSGGGTVAVEALKRGMVVYAQDLHPWPTRGLSVALDPVDPNELSKAIDKVLTSLQATRTEMYGVVCPDHGEESETVHSFWVQARPCPRCSQDVYLFPYALFTVSSRIEDEPHGWFGCSACGEVTRSRLTTTERRCRGCRRRLGGEETVLLPGRQATCRHCRFEFECLGANMESHWHLALVQRLCRTSEGTVLHFAPPGPADLAVAMDAAENLPAALKARIPRGDETSLLRRAGFKTWNDLYPPRQLTSLIRAVNAVRKEAFDPTIESRLLLAVAGAGEMAGYTCRWDRFYPKAFEALANHRYNFVGTGAEVNLLGPRGRGTLPRRFAASLKAATWLQQEGFPKERVALRSNRGPKENGSNSVIVYGTSEAQALSDGIADLVLTDPPYFDDVQYGELAYLFSAWAVAVELVGSTHVNLEREAVPNRSRGTSEKEYGQILAKVLKETRRTLKPDGRMLLTFHNRDIRAWHCLAAALYQAGFRVAAIAVAHAENESDHPKRGRLAFTKDLVLECQSARMQRPLLIAREPVDDQERELIAAGRTVAEGGRWALDAFSEQFTALAEGVRKRRIIVPSS